MASPLTTPRPAAAAPPAPKRMTLASVTRGVVDAPLRVLLYGVPGVGKSTFAAGAPAPVFLGAEDGTNHLNVARFPAPHSWRDVLDAVRELEGQKDYKTLVIDTVDSLEPLCWRAVVDKDPKAKTIEDVGGGFQKGYVAAVDEWRVFLAALERLRANGMWIVLLAHSQVKPFKNPQGPDYERYTLKVEAKYAAPALVEWVDDCLFAQFEAWTTEEKRPKGLSSDVRIIRTRRTAAYDAKNRHGLPEHMPLSWDEYMAGIRANRPADPVALKQAIEDGIQKLSTEDASKARAALELIGDDVARLAQLENRISSKTREVA